MTPFDESLARLVEHDLDGEALAELLRQASEDPRQRQRIAAQLWLHGHLGVAMEDDLSRERRHRRILAAIQASDQRQFIEKVQSRIVRRFRFQRLLAVAAAVIIAILGWQFVVSPRSRAIASIERLSAVDWGRTSPLARGSSLAQGSRLSFDGGLVELTLGDKGSMIVEGPAELEILAPDHSLLHRGRAHLRVTPAGHGYRLQTPRGTILDLGTEFGVAVLDDRSVETHVIEGEVEALPLDGSRVKLLRNEAIRLGDGENLRIAADTGTFYTSLPPSHPSTLPYVHWSFDDSLGRSTQGISRGFASDQAVLDFKAMAPGTPPSPLPGVFNRGLSFDGIGGFAESPFPGIGGTDPRTVSFWVKVPSDFRPREGFALISWGRYQGENFGGVWQISINPLAEDGPLGRLRVGTHGGQIVGATDLRDDQWHHVAVVLFPASKPDIGKHALIYLDGRPETLSRRTLRELDTATENAGHGVWLGRNVTSDPTARSGHGSFFRGALDEVYIFAGALSAREIRDLHSRNVPPP